MIASNNKLRTRHLIISFAHLISFAHVIEEHIVYLRVRPQFRVRRIAPRRLLEATCRLGMPKLCIQRCAHLISFAHGIEQHIVNLRVRPRFRVRCVTPRRLNNRCAEPRARLSSA
jgi:hypothetical protein